MSPTEFALLDVRNCSLRFGGLSALTDVSLTINPGELVGLIGPNGAGKTSLFNILTGVYQPTSGEILIEGRHSAGPTASVVSEWHGHSRISVSSARWTSG